MTYRAILIIVLVAAGIAPPASAAEFATEELAIDVEVVADRLRHPWAVAMLPDGSLLVTERRGSLLHIAGDRRTEIAGVPAVAAVGQGGLLDVAVDEDFARSRRIWLSYAEPGPGGASTALATGVLSADGSRLEHVERLFVMARKTGTRLHFGSRIVLAPDDMLFLTTGDRGDGPRAQDFFDSAGAVIRLKRNGTVPPDNPFADGTRGLPELWSKGHRNIQGAAWDAARGLLWTVEHGAMGGDEINRPEPGRNYGWPVITYGRNYDGARIGIGTEAPGYEQPVHYWDPSIAPSGLAVVSGDLFGEWRGDLLVGALAGQMLVRLSVDAQGRIVGEERMLEGRYGRIRDVRVLADGAVWMVTDEPSGQLLRITPVRR
ncbi:MAG: glucose dehydrogenase [Alphaproteobacteria bacterium]|nr:MAG: glucose dehydrogenase [Alphaproteobacteria bacterium]